MHNTRPEQMALWASLVIAATALASLVIGIWNYNRNAQAQVQFMALTTLQSYLDLAVEHPDLASHDDKQPIDARYAWFAAHALVTAQTLRTLVGREGDWQRAIDAIVRQHRPYLHSGAFVCADYSPEFVGYLQHEVPGLRCAPTRDAE